MRLEMVSKLRQKEVKMDQKCFKDAFFKKCVNLSQHRAKITQFYDAKITKMDSKKKDKRISKTRKNDIKSNCS